MANRIRGDVAAALLAPVLLLGSVGARAAGNEIVIGEITDQSAAWLEAGRDYVAGAKTYFDLVNSEGGVNGKKIVHVVKNAGGDPQEIARTAGELVGEGKVDVLFGNIGDATMRSLADSHFAEKQNIAVFAPLTGLTSQQIQIKTMRASYADEARALVKHFTGLGLTSFCLVIPPGAEHKASAQAVREAVGAINRQLVCEAPIDDNGVEAKATAKAINKVRPQAVIVLGDTTIVGNFVREFPFKALGIAVGALSIVNNTTLMELAGPQAARGLVLTQVVPPPSRESVPVVREHVRAMRKFRDEPPSQLTLEGFIAAKTMVDALRRPLAGKTFKREDVTAALAGLPDSSLTALISDYAATNAAGGSRLIEVTMVGSDGRLIQ